MVDAMLFMCIVLECASTMDKSEEFKEDYYDCVFIMIARCRWGSGVFSSVGS